MVVGGESRDFPLCPSVYPPSTHWPWSLFGRSIGQSLARCPLWPRRIGLGIRTSNPICLGPLIRFLGFSQGGRACSIVATRHNPGRDVIVVRFHPVRVRHVPCPRVPCPRVDGVRANSDRALTAGGCGSRAAPNPSNKPWRRRVSRPSQDWVTSSRGIRTVEVEQLELELGGRLAVVLPAIANPQG